MGDAARRQLALTIRGGLPNTPAGGRRPRFRCSHCGEIFRGVRGVMQHQNAKHATRWPDTLILADQDPPKDVWQGVATPVLDDGDPS